MATTTKETAPKTEEKMKIMLPLTREKQDDVFVSLNGESMKIQRGVEVEVSKGIYEVLKESERMDLIALQRLMEKPNKQV